MLTFKTSCAVLAYLSSNLLNEVGLSLFRYFEVGLRVCDIVVKKFTFSWWVLVISNVGINSKSFSLECTLRTRNWRNLQNFLRRQQRTISPISRQSNFTKFKHNTSIGEAIKTFKTQFWKFYRKGSFFPKNAKISRALRSSRMWVFHTIQQSILFFHIT